MKLSAVHHAAAPVKLDDPLIAAAAAIGKVAFERQADENAAPLTQAAVAIDVSAAAVGVKQCAAAAFDLAKARIDGDTAAAALAGAQLEKFGHCDPRWGECIAEFVAHYTLTRHADVPYRRWKSPDDFVINSLPAECQIGIIGDWGTGDASAVALLREVARLKPDLLIHLGDIYYSCTASEAERFYELCTS